MLSFVLCTLMFAGASDAQSTPGAQAPPAAAEPQVQGRVIEEGTQAPVAGAQVMLLPAPPPAPPPNSVPSMTRAPSAATDAEGRFRFSGVAAGRYRLSVQKPGFALPLEAMFRLPEVIVTAGVPAAPAELTVQRGAVFTGRVVDAGGEPVVNARVMAMRRRPEPPAGAPAVVREAMARSTNRLVAAGPASATDDRGEFRVHSLPAGEYFLQAVPMPAFGGGASTPAAGDTAFVPTFFPEVTSQDEAQAITVAAGQGLDGLTIRMATAAVFQVSGQVVDESGAPVADAQVRSVPRDPADLGPMAMPGMTHADSSGAFTLPQVRAGAHTLIVAAPEVLARDPSAPAGGGSTTTFVGPGIGAGPLENTITTAVRNGVTVRYRDADGTKLPVTVEEQHVRGLRIVVKRPAPPQ